MQTARGSDDDARYPDEFPVGKYYRAQALGIFEHNEGTLEDYLVKDGRTNTSRVCEENVPDAR